MVAGAPGRKAKLCWAGHASGKLRTSQATPGLKNLPGSKKGVTKGQAPSSAQSHAAATQAFYRPLRPPKGYIVYCEKPKASY